MRLRDFISMPFPRPACALAVVIFATTALAGCSSVGFGIGVPVGPVSLGVGIGSGGVSAGVGAGAGPLGVGVGVDSGGRVVGGAGVGTSVPIGGGPARAGVGVGTGVVIHDPARAAPRLAPQRARVAPGGPPRDSLAY